MSARYWMRVTDDRLARHPQWPAGLRLIREPWPPPQRDAAVQDPVTLSQAARWLEFEDDGAPAELEGQRVQLAFAIEDGKAVITRRRILPDPR